MNDGLMEFNYDKIIKEIQERLDEFCSSIIDDESRDVMNERNKLIIDMLTSFLPLSKKVVNRFCEYYEKNGFNPYSLYVIALGAEIVNDKVSYQKEWYDAKIYEYFDKLIQEVSVEEFTYLGSFFYTNKFDSMIRVFISPEMCNINGTYRNKYVFPQYGIWGALKELYNMLQKDEPLEYYDAKLINILKRDFAVFYRYLNNIDNDKLKKDVFLSFMRLSNWFYRDMKFSSYHFSDIVYFIFGSDSFTEMSLKFEFLNDMIPIASHSKHPEILLERILEFVDSDKFKEICRGKLVKTDFNFYANNHLEVKKKIIDRMKDLYSRIDSDFSFAVLNNNYNNASLIFDLAFGEILLRDSEFAKFCSEYVKEIEKKPVFPYTDNLIYIKAIGMNKEFRDLFCQFYDKNKENISADDLYIITLSFQLQGDNYENFKAILDDLSDCIPNNLNISWYVHDALFLFHLLGDSNYKDMSNLRMYFKNYVKEYSGNLNNLDEKALALMEELVKKRYGDRSNDWKDDLFVHSEVLNGELGYLLDENKEFFYQDILGKRKNRVSYINSMLHEIEDNPSIRRDIFSNISELSVELFSKVDLGHNKDLFIECMKIVFDSDTYSEMLSKFKVLKDASEEFKKDNKEKALQMIKDLGCVSHKDILNGQLVTYPENCMNRVIKPKRMIDRMKYLYSTIDSSISYDFLDKLHEVADNIESIEKSIHNHRKNPFCKIKQKFNRLNQKNKIM